jgi:acyl-CoA thioester hydrolase
MNRIELHNEIQIRARYAETDKMGFVYNSNYLVYFEVARTELMREHGLPYSKFEEYGFNLPLTDAYVKYHRPALYDDLLTIKGHVEWSGEPRLKFNYEVFVNDTLITSGYTTHAFLNSKTKMPVRPPEIFINAMQDALKVK